MNPLKRHLRRLTGKDAAFRPEPALEDIYRHLFTRDLEALGEQDRFYPTGGAANYSLLYLIQRIAQDLRPDSVLDIGAGQSTILWNLMLRHRLVNRVTTLEHDPGWADSIGAKVDHELLVTPLQTSRIGTVQTQTYDWARTRERGPFDVVVCDGPIGVPHFSRFGVLSLLDETLPTNFALVLDDAERAGEQDTVGAIHDRLKQLGRRYSATVVRAGKCQAVFATGEYEAICHV